MLLATSYMSAAAARRISAGVVVRILAFRMKQRSCALRSIVRLRRYTHTHTCVHVSEYRRGQYTFSSRKPLKRIIQYIRRSNDPSVYSMKYMRAVRKSGSSLNISRGIYWCAAVLRCSAARWWLRESNAARIPDRIETLLLRIGNCNLAASRLCSALCVARAWISIACGYKNANVYIHIANSLPSL